MRAGAVPRHGSARQDFRRESRAEELLHPCRDGSRTAAWVLMGTVRQCPSRHCDPSASQAAGNTRGKAIQRHVLRSQCCLAWGWVRGCGGSPEGAAPHSLLRFVLQMGTNQPPAAPPLRGRGVCTGAGIAQHWQRLHNTDWGSSTPQALLDAVCTCAPRTGRAGEIHGRGCVCRTQGAVFSGGGRLRVQREAGVAKRASVCAGAGSQPGSAGHRPASSPSVRPSVSSQLWARKEWQLGAI